MKVIFWNLWGGKHTESILDWLGRNPADIYGYQEVFRVNPEIPEWLHHKVIARRDGDSLLFRKLIQNHPGMHHYFSRLDKGQDAESVDAIYKGRVDAGANRNLEAGNALFISRSIYMKRTYSSHLIHDSAHEGLGLKSTWTLQTAVCRDLNSGKLFTIGNLRGAWFRDGKGDNDFRIKQSLKILEALIENPAPYILGGDFNVLPNTESIVMLEDFGLRNLIKDYSITTTRSKLHRNNVPWADYCFVSPEVEVVNFTVPKAEGSDHLPLVLEFNI